MTTKLNLNKRRYKWRFEKLGLKLDRYSFKADSRVVSEVFGKNHKDFLRKIENIINNIKITERNFEPSELFVEKEYIDSSGKIL